MNKRTTADATCSLMETRIMDWLQRRRRLRAPAYLLGAIGTLVGGLVIFAATAVFAFIAFIIAWTGIAAAWQIVTGRAVPRFPKTGIAWFTAVFLVLLFFSTSRSKWWERGAIPKGVWSVYSNRKNPPSVSATAIGLGKIATDLLSTGPRLLYSAWLTFGKSLRWWRLHIGPSARVLTLLHNSENALPRQLLASQLPPAFHWLTVERQLHEIEGVLFLECGLTLSEELRSELNQITHAPA